MSYWELVERADRGRRWELAANAVIFNAAWISVRAECDDRFPACIRTPPSLGTNDPSHTLIDAIAGLAAGPAVAELLTTRARHREADTPDAD
ncbi:hypothetical protein QDX25_08860 [Auritidibacter ignavus]|uniref:hypothetical protein n=1 Tax=Auritidibacter TaxID=1160973 RepID=UPI000D72F277|nr:MULTISPECIES: hypothetical protein [Auritidibacter]PXA79367.1 hypothetical protein DCC25_09560 [Auritidibacter sp. NML120636]WGH80902.1 hypothetical protein QDX25_08860 [Auritidibacter ignavus]